jgi:hypothetical protein
VTVPARGAAVFVTCAIVACAACQPAPVGTGRAPAYSPKAEAPPVPPPGASPDRALDPAQARAQAAERYVTALEHVATLFSDQGNDCAALARALAGATEARDELRESSTPDAHPAARADPTLGPRLEKATDAITDGSMACSRDPAFEAQRTKLFPPAPSNQE